jgi:hypothetical protein
MKFIPMLAVAALAGSSLTLIAQQPDPAPQQSPTTPAPATTAPTTPSTATQGTPQTTPGASEPAAPAQTAGTGTNGAAAAPSVEMRPVNGELESKLDSQSAKTGDQVVVKTKEPVKTADGTVIPKGSKLMGHVAKVQSHSQGSQNSAVAIEFDHVELKGGQTLQIASVIDSLAPAASGDMAPSGSDATSSPMASSAPAGGGTATRQGGAAPNATTGASTAPTDAPAAAAAAPSGGTAGAGKVVGKVGNDPIRTTAIPGIFLATTTPSEASMFSGLLFAAKSEVHLEGGTQVGMEVAMANVR